MEKQTREDRQTDDLAETVKEALLRNLVHLGDIEHRAVEVGANSAAHVLDAAGRIAGGVIRLALRASAEAIDATAELGTRVTQAMRVVISSALSAAGEVVREGGVVAGRTTVSLLEAARSTLVVALEELEDVGAAALPRGRARTVGLHREEGAGDGSVDRLLEVAS